jgi:uridylate kinase
MRLFYFIVSRSALTAGAVEDRMADDARCCDAISTAYRRALLKLSGETLLGTNPYGIDPGAASQVAEELRDVLALGVQLCVVVGGGNIFRGLAASAKGMDRVKADYMGMAATVMNAIALENALANLNVPAVIHSALPFPVAKTFQRDEAVRDLKSGKIVIFAGGTGNPFFTTDTTAALRAAEMHCDVILKATQVDGVYSADPRKHADATRYDTLSYDEALTKRLEVMDAAAFAIARDTQIPIMVFAGEKKGSIVNALTGRAKATLVMTQVTPPHIVL